MVVQRNEMTNMGENQLAREVSNYLKDKRYFIVLDDVPHDLAISISRDSKFF